MLENWARRLKMTKEDRTAANIRSRNNEMVVRGTGIMLEMSCLTSQTVRELSSRERYRSLKSDVVLRLQSSQHGRPTTQPVSVDRCLGRTAVPFTALALLHNVGSARRQNDSDHISVPSLSLSDVTSSHRQNDFRSVRDDVTEKRDSAVMGDVWRGSRYASSRDGGVAQRPDDEFEASALCPQCSRQLRIEVGHHGHQPDTATARLPSTATIQRRTAPR